MVNRIEEAAEELEESNYENFPTNPDVRKSYLDTEPPLMIDEDFESDGENSEEEETSMDKN